MDEATAVLLGKLPLDSDIEKAKAAFDQAQGRFPNLVTQILSVPKIDIAWPSECGHPKSDPRNERSVSAKGT